MTEIPTHRELRERARDAALLVTDRLTARSFDPGFMPGILAGLSADLAQEVIQIALAFHSSTFFRTAVGADLDRLALDHFGLERRVGAAAIGIATFSRAAVDFGPLLIPARTRVATPDGTIFITTEEPLMSGLVQTAAIRAEVTGDAGVVDAGKITQLISLLEDGTVSVTNTERTAGGLTRETDDQFRERLRGYLSTVRRGTAGAIEFGALSVGGVVRATLDESSYPPTLYISDQTGGANTALVQLVADTLIDFRAAGVHVNVIGATVIDQPITLAFAFAAGIDTAAAREVAIAAVVAAVNGIAIGATLFRSLIVAAAKVAGVTNVVVSIPAGDIVPTQSQLIRTERTLVTVS